MARTRRGRGETRWLCRWLRIVGRLQPPQRRRRGHPDVYSSAAMVQAFFVMTVKKIKRFQGLYNYLANNDIIRRACGFRDGLPHRRTFTRRFRRLAGELGDWMRQAAQEAISQRYITARVVAADKSLHPARGPLWHAKDRRRGRVPKKLRGVDRDSRWGYSPYHKFVQGYAEHTVVNASPGEARFPLDAVADTAQMVEHEVLRGRLGQLPATTRKILIDGQYDDNGLLGELRRRKIRPVLPAGVFRKAAPKSEVRRWAARVRAAKVNQRLYRRRRTTIEPHFGLDKKRFENHTVWFYGLANNRTHLSLVSFVIQVLMLDNFEQGRPPEDIQWLLDAAA
jgi:Transposase DDE domain